MYTHTTGPLVYDGDEKEDLQEFEMLSYVVEDDFSEASWEFTVDEEGNIYHFF